MPRGYADWDPPENPYDFGRAIWSGYDDGQTDSARRQARSYADAGDFDAAARALLERDPQGAQNYLTYGERQRDTQFNREAGEQVLRGDYEGAAQTAVRMGRGPDVVRQIRAMAAQASEQQLAQARQTYGEIARVLIDIDQLPMEQRQEAYARARSDLLQRFPTADASQIPEAYSPALFQSYARQIQDASDAVEAELARRNPEWRTDGTTPYRIRDGVVELGQGEIPHRPQQWMQPGGYRLVQPDEAEARGLPPGVYQENERTGQVTPLAPPRAQYTEGQTAAASYALRMRAADETMTEIEDRNRNNQQFWNDVWTVGAVGLGGPDVQRYRQAIREFQNAILRRESGAVIAQSEFDSARQQYAPNPLTRPETMEQNRAARRRSIEGVEFQSQGAIDDLRERNGSQPRPRRTPSPAAIEYLRRNPQTARQFEQHYGLQPGGAQSFMRDGPDQ